MKQGSVITLALFLLGCAASPAALPTPAAKELARVADAPDSAGELVYRGSVYTPADQLAFRYERRVGSTGNDRVSTHITWAADGTPVVSHTANHDDAYVLKRFVEIHRQTGVAGSATVLAGNELEFEVRARGRHIVRRQQLHAPAVVGPTLFGFALQNWERLASGQAVDVAFVVVERARAYGFTLRAIDAPSDELVVEVAAKNALVRRSVPPMKIVFDRASQQIRRFEGRVPPLLEGPRGLQALDARVEYSAVAPRYR